MTPRRGKSRRRSAASSLAARRLEQAVIYLDESIYSRLLVSELRGCGITVRHAGEAFPFGTQDSVWLAACGARGWIVLTRDQRIRRRTLEREAIKVSGAAVFAFTTGVASAADTAAVVTRLLPKIVNIATSEPKPCLYTFGVGGRLSRARLR